MADDTVLYVVRPGWIVSKNDGDKHFVGMDSLIRLYGLENKKYERFNLFRYYANGYPPNTIFLHPRYDGKYKKVS